MRLTPQMTVLVATDPQRRPIRAIIRDAYAKAGNLAGAAELLGTSEANLSAWIRRLGGQIRSEVEFPDLQPQEAVAA